VDFAVIICAHSTQRWAMLTQAADSVLRQTLAAREVILVIDGNEELRRRALAAFPGVTVVANHYTPGLSGARQSGADVASASILAFLDDDAIADPEWLAELARGYEDPEVLGVGGPVEPLWLAGEPEWLPPEFHWIVGCTYVGMPVRAGRVRNLIGANMSMRAAVLRAAGTFAPDLARRGDSRRFSGTADDTEFCIRAARLYPGGYWLYRPPARVRHQVPAERTTWRYFVRRCRVEAAAKAILTSLDGTSAALASERAYVRSALPRALSRELTSAARGDPAALRRAVTIVCGLSITVLSYVVGRARRVRSGPP
jgi:glycosyltransferase involved in cell wall biosynthesis